MKTLIENEKFKADYLKLKTVSLNPERHSAGNAYEHCQMVAERAAELALLNQCSSSETECLITLAKVHDIGKILGTARPEGSLKLLQQYDALDDEFLNMVKYHDTNLPWYISMQKGQPPSHKAWGKLGRKVNMRLLCIFMVADRVDCPGGWQANAALVWFLDEATKRGFLPEPLTYD